MPNSWGYFEYTGGGRSPWTSNVAARSVPRSYDRLYVPRRPAKQTHTLGRQCSQRLNVDRPANTGRQLQTRNYTVSRTEGRRAIIGCDVRKLRRDYFRWS